MPIYCDESGGVGRGVMTLAAILIGDEDATSVLHRFREMVSLANLKAAVSTLQSARFCLKYSGIMIGMPRSGLPFRRLFLNPGRTAAITILAFTRDC